MGSCSCPDPSNMNFTNATRFAENCTETEELIVTPWRYAIKHYVVPVQVIFGLAGNFLTVVILNSRCLRSRTTVLLTCLTLADAAVLACLIPSSLATFSFAYTSEGFRQFFYATQVPLLMLSNSFSAASIWLALSVTVERVLVISRPLRAQLPFSGFRTGALVSAIALAALATSSYNLVHSEFLPCPVAVRAPYSNLTKLRLVRSLQAYADPSTRQWIDASNLFNFVFILCVPFLGMIVLNWILLHFIRSSRKTLSALGRTHSNRIAITTERKIGIMVCAIVGAFIFFNLPSAIIAVFNTLGIRPSTEWRRRLTYISNSLVATGKTLNFVLYCISSDHFRRRVVASTSGSKCIRSRTAGSSGCRKKSSELVHRSPYVFKLLNGDNKEAERLLSTRSAPPDFPRLNGGLVEPASQGPPSIPVLEPGEDAV